MPEHLDVEIPKGTVILLNKRTQILTKSMKLVNEGNNIILKNAKEVSMKDDERLGDMMTNLPECKKIKMPNVKKIKEKLDIDVVDLAYKIASNPDIDSAVRKKANAVLTRILNKEIAKHSDKDDKTTDKEQISE